MPGAASDTASNGHQQPEQATEPVRPAANGGVTASPTDEQVLDALRALRDPELGIKKVLDKFKADNQWSLSLDRLKKLSSQGEGLRTKIAPIKGPKLYQVVDIKGKGQGVVAIKPIAKGQCVMIEHPMMIAGRETAEQGFKQLTEEQQKVYSSLSASAPGKTINERIFQCNAYAWHNAAAIFPTIPRVNHSCTPNVNYVADFEHTTGQFYALKNLQTGEELTSSYTERVQPRAIRRRFLQESYRFICHCETCNLPLKEQRKSDLRRQMAKNIDGALVREEDLARALQLVQIRLRLLTEEGLDGPDAARTLNDAVQLSARKGALVLSSCFARAAEFKYRSTGNALAARELKKRAARPQDNPAVEPDVVHSMEHPTLKLGAEGLGPEEILPAVFGSFGWDKAELKAVEEKVKEEAQRGLEALNAHAHARR